MTTVVEDGRGTNGSTDTLDTLEGAIETDGASETSGADGEDAAALDWGTLGPPGPPPPQEA